MTNTPFVTCECCVGRESRGAAQPLTQVRFRLGTGLRLGLVQSTNMQAVWAVVKEVLNVFTSLSTIAASSLAIYIYLKNKDRIATAFQLLLSYSYQVTLAELKQKIEKLNDFVADEPTHIPDIQNVLHEIVGQISGNTRLNAHLSDSVNEIRAFSKALSDFEHGIHSGRRTKGRVGVNVGRMEPAKRSLVSLLKEKVKELQVDMTKQDEGSK